MDGVENALGRRKKIFSIFSRKIMEVFDSHVLYVYRFGLDHNQDILYERNKKKCGEHVG